MKRLFLLVCLIVFYGVITVPASRYLLDRPVALKLGYTPSSEAIKLVVGDQKLLLAESLVIKVLFYFGSLVEKSMNRVDIPPEYYGMFKTLKTAVMLDPYNQDAYYFAQAAFTWEVGHAEDVNKMLIYGMEYRDWDMLLPFFVGFNAAYFLKDYEMAAIYTRRAAEISGSDLLTNLTARYFYEANHDQMGIAFLKQREENTKDQGMKSLYRLRRESLEAAQALQRSLERFVEKFGHQPEKIDRLVEEGMISHLPDDPYGGEFYLDSHGKVRSTSNFSFTRGADAVQDGQ
ncbi:MAG: hypothetical protein C0621_11105 [Desulfuromonas sp.]|nr:MAG: hypothetical protein C0621_11105 [Desulfuromonas sp.]